MFNEALCSLHPKLGRPREALSCPILNDDLKIAMPTLIATKQQNKEPVKTFVERFLSAFLWCPSCMTHTTLVETCHYNLQTLLLSQTEVVECCTWKQLVQRSEQIEQLVQRDEQIKLILARVQTEVQSFHVDEEDALGIDVKRSKSTSNEGWFFKLGPALLGNIHLRMSTLSLFKPLDKRNMLKFLEA